MPGTSTMVRRMNEISPLLIYSDGLEYASALPIMKMAMPELNLSSREYMPNTNAPVLAFAPTTSEMRLMPVDSTRDWEAPMKRAMIYINQLSSS